MTNLAFPTRRAALHAAAALSLAVPLAGCVVAPVGPYPGYYSDVVTVAPPAPRAEVYGVAPIAGSVWIGGYWGHGRRGHHWVPGHWAGPRPGYRWAPHHWVPHHHGWRLNRGHWQRG